MAAISDQPAWFPPTLQRVVQSPIPAGYAFMLKPTVQELALTLDISICAIVAPTPHFMRIVAAVGTDLTLVHRDHAFCSHMISGKDEVVVEDAAQDAKFRDNPYVVDGPRLRFYACTPLDAPNGDVMGAICIADTMPRRFSAATKSLLTATARAVSRKIADEANEALLLSQLDTATLLQLLRAEPKANKHRLIQLADALHSRLEADHWAMTPPTSRSLCAAEEIA